MTANAAQLVTVRKIITEGKDGFHVWSHDHSKHLGGPYPTKVQAMRRLRQVEHFKEEDAKRSDTKKDDAERWLGDLRKATGHKRGGGGAQQAYDSHGRYASGTIGAAAATAGFAARGAARAVRGKVNVKNTKKVARNAVHIIKPIIRTVGKAAFAGAMAGLVMGVEMTFSSAGTDVGKATGAMAAAAAKDLQRRAEEKSGLFVSARMRNKGNGKVGVSVQPTQSVSPSASSFDLSRVDVSTPAGVSSPFGRPINTPGASQPTRAGVSVSPYMMGSMYKAEDVTKADDEDHADSDVWVVMPLEDFDEAQFADAIDRECKRISKRAMFFG